MVIAVVIVVVFDGGAVCGSQVAAAGLAESLKKDVLIRTACIGGTTLWLIRDGLHVGRIVENEGWSIPRPVDDESDGQKVLTGD